MDEKISGTLAIDLGNTNTVLTFQNERYGKPDLIKIPLISKYPGIVPTAIWYQDQIDEVLIGLKALEKIDDPNQEKYYYSNFKRLIGNPYEKFKGKVLTPEEAGEKFFKTLWNNIPNKFEIKRLVLTAPIDTYKGYRKWLLDICNSLPIQEIALVDEPTAAGIGINVPFGSKIMILDIGGSTIDFNIVKIEGGEGKSAPIAELLKFDGKDVSSISKQKLRCAEIISKSACKIGGKDLDKWILNHFIDNNEDSRNLIITEKVKCILSDNDINPEQKFSLSLYVNNEQKKEFSLNKKELEEILISNNLINLLNSLLKQLLNDARGKNCDSKDIHSIILVGGGSQIPLIRNWISFKLPDLRINYPPPIESIAVGALSLTPGVKIKDILDKNLLIRLFNKREKKHFWHTIFYKGQTWPTEKPFELIIQSSKDEQKFFEIIIGESSAKNDFDVIFENGIPKLSEIQSEEQVIPWKKEKLLIELDIPATLGEDCLKLLFQIDENSNLFVKYTNFTNQVLGTFNLGSIY